MIKRTYYIRKIEDKALRLTKKIVENGLKKSGRRERLNASNALRKFAIKSCNALAVSV